MSSVLLGKVLIDLAIILVCAYVVGAMLARIGQPPVVGQIVAGILLGPTLLGLVPGSHLFSYRLRWVLTGESP